MAEQKFTPRAENVLRLAQETALELGHGYVGCEHILLGLLREDGGAACRALGEAGVTEEFVRKELDSGRLKKLKTSFEIPARSVDMCLLSDVPQSAAAERFTDFVKDSLSKL